MRCNSTKKELLEWINSFLLKESGSLYSARARDEFLKQKYVEYYDTIISMTSFLDKEVKVSERIYCVLHDINEVVRCNCGKDVQFVKFSMGYKKYCCNKCMQLDLESINAKKSSACKKTCLEKYGVENVFQLEDVKDKIKKTCLEKFGVENSFQSEEVRDKQKSKMVELYGVDHNMRSDYLKDKLKEKYGGVFPMHSEESKKKAKDTFEINYKFGHPSREHFSDKAENKINDKKWLENKHIKEKFSCNDIAKELEIGLSTVIRYMNKHKIDIKYYPVSQYEEEIINFINLNNTQINVRNIISPYELDVYLPDYKLAIEFDGLYWHSRHSKNYHLNKTQMCNNKNIQLLHVFENEWLDSIKQDIWKSIINGKLDRNNSIYGRKCEIREIKDSALIRKFLNRNHLQGYCSGSIKLGLFYEDELVSLMTFGKTRFSKKYQYEMIRFCNKKFISVVGGASKLFKYFITNYKPESVVSYADRRYSIGSLYKKLGFEFSHCSNPNYFYFKNGTLDLYSRVKFQKHKLKDLLENFDSEKSEKDNMLDNNYYRIFDCGNYVFIYNGDKQ